jgi:gliding motility-associated-like protein
MSFTPNITQRSLVVYNVREFRGGVFVGTTQREMTVVTTTCTNAPPTGVISSPSAGTLVSPTQLNLCGNTGPFNFHINPTDPNGDTITMTASGLPAGATLAIANNSTTAPLGTFSWNTTGVTPGMYTFFVNYQDHGCPLTSSQTIAYIIRVLPVATATITLISPVTCVAKAVFQVSPAGATSPYTIKVLSGSSVLHTFGGVTGPITDSLPAGSYTISITNSENCASAIPLTLSAPITPSVSIASASPLCYGASTGTITATASGGVAPYTYALGSGAYGASGVFTGLAAGTYTISVRDAYSCTVSTSVVLTDPSPMHVHAGVTSPVCSGVTSGSVLLTPFGSTGPFTYAMGTGSYGSSNLFGGLAPGVYTFHIKNANGCIKDTTLTLTDSLHIGITATAPAILCNGASTTITINGTGSPAAYIYAYDTSPYSTTNTFPLTAGTYTLHVRDANMCQHDTTITLTQPTPGIPTTTAVNVICYGAGDGSISVSASGGTPGYTYSIGGGSYGTSSVFSPLPAGSYTVNVKDANGCIYTTVAAITESSAIVLDSVRVIKPTCFGNTNGSIQVYAHGGVTPYTYATGTGSYSSSSLFTGMATGTYLVHIKDANGCTKDTTINMLQPAQVAVTAGVVRPICSPLANGSVTLIASGGTPSYSYSLGTGAFGTSPVFSLLAPGTYAFHIKDANGCIKDTTIALTDSLHVGITATAPAILCNGASTTVTLGGTGSPATYTYAYGTSPYSTTNTFPLTAGTYTLHVRDANLCQHDTTITLTQPTPGIATPTAVNVICHGAANGTISVSASGGTPGYTYSIGSGSFGTSSTFSPLPAGSYTIKAKDANGCIYTTVATITEPSAIVLDSVRVTKPTCYGSTNGSIQLYAHGGVTPYTYATGTGSYSSSSLLTGMAAGTYLVHIKDANGCTKDTTINMLQPARVAVTANVVRPICSTVPNGSVTLIASGGTPAYTYAVGTGAYGGSSIFSPLTAGTYAFHIKDANGCIKDTTITLTDSLHIGITVSAPSILCNGGVSTVTVSGTGSPAPYTYAPGSSAYSTTNTFPMTVGTYVLHVRDANMCQHDTTITITQPTPGVVTAIASNVACHGGASGIITVGASGGTPGYTYSISSGSYGTSPIFSPLTAGSYIIKVKDAHGCIYTAATTTVTEPTAIVLDSVRVIKPTCYGSTNGSIQLYAHGGVTPYTYAIGTGSYSSSSLFTGMAAGTYLMHIKDANGCMKDTTINMLQPARVALTASILRPICSTLANGSVTLSASGGTPSYAYSIGTGAYSASTVFSPLAAGTYAFHIKDANGCIKDTTISLSDSLIISATVSASPVLCYGAATGSITATGSGGTSPYTYAIGSGSYGSTSTFGGLISSTYTIHVKDNNGCTYSTTSSIIQPTLLVPHVTLTNPTCYGYANGTIAVTATGGTPAYQYAINSGSYSVTAAFTALGAGTKIIHVKDNNGCIHDTTVIITQPDPIAMTLAPSPIRCFGESGAVTASVAGGTPSYWYAADAGGWQTSNVLTGLTASIHFIHLKDNNGCTMDTGVSMTQPPPLVLTGRDTLAPTCEGYKNGAVVLHANGGTLPYQYSDDNTTFTSDSAFNMLGVGSLTFYIKDANGCHIDTAIALNGHQHIWMTATVAPTTCYGKNDGVIIAQGGGTSLAPMTWHISGPGVNVATDSIGGLVGGIYIITATDTQNCKKDSSVFVPQPPALSLAFTVVNNLCDGYEDRGAITATVTGGTPPYKYRWNRSTKTDPTIGGLPNGHYAVWVTDANNCPIADTTNIAYEECCKPFIPDAFTPNGDGTNDVFRIAHKGDMRIVEFSVYNRFGEQVFTTSRTDEGWDGRYRGTAADMGVYFYYARIICGINRTDITMLKGDVTLIR